MGLHVFPIPIPPPISLSTRSLQVFPVHQVLALVSCIQPGLVICFTLDNIHVSMLFSWTSFLCFLPASMQLFLLQHMCSSITKPLLWLSPDWAPLTYFFLLSLQLQRWQCPPMVGSLAASSCLVCQHSSSHVFPPPPPTSFLLVPLLASLHLNHLGRVLLSDGTLTYRKFYNLIFGFDSFVMSQL